MKKPKKKYINNNPRYGIDYDWKLIHKEFNKLGIPAEVFNPYKFHEICGGKYIWDMSERDVGKTTQWLLIAMVINRLYGSEIVYMREIVDMISPRNDAELFKTILFKEDEETPNYVEKLTDGQYNRIICRSRRYYLCNTDTGETEIDPFMIKWSLDENDDKKSSVQLPDSDIIIFDEAISRRYSHPDEFVLFMDSIKTIIRRRFSPLIVMLANTIDIQSFWFSEFEIYDQIQDMQPGDQRLIQTEGGTIVDIALVGSRPEDMTADRIEHNKRFFGFKNPKLNSIRGGSWAFSVYQHPYRCESVTVDRTRYIEHNGKLVNLEVRYNDDHGLYIVVHKANDIYDDSVVYTIDKQLKDKRYKYKWGLSRMDDKLLKMYHAGRWTYVSNAEGSLVENYISLMNKI